MRLNRKILFAIVLTAVLAWAWTALFVVEATETAIVARFSSPMDRLYQPGLHIKAPWPVDSVYRFDKRILTYDHAPTEFLTEDKKNILIDSFAVWRIDDEHKYLAKVRSRDVAEVLLLEIVTAVLGELTGSYPLSSFVNTDESKVSLNEINRKLAQMTRESDLREYGINVIDTRINMFNFPDQNRTSVISRMRAERARIATRYRSEGEEEALKIEASTEKEVRMILAEAKREAEVIRGKGESTAISTYGKAYEEDPEFYRFMRSLEAYEQIVDEKTTVVLDENSRIFNVLEESAP